MRDIVSVVAWCQFVLSYFQLKSGKDHQLCITVPCQFHELFSLHCLLGPILMHRATKSKHELDKNITSIAENYDQLRLVGLLVNFPEVR